MKRRIGCAAVVAAAAGSVLGGLYWALGAYRDIVRKEVSVHAAWSDLENACQRRLDLIRTVLDAAPPGARAVEAMREAHARASELVLSPATLEDPDRVRRFEERQAEISAALSGLLAWADTGATPRWSEGFRETREALAAADGRIVSEQRELAEAVGAYNAAVRSFPRSIVAAFLRKAPMTPPEIAPTIAEGAPGLR